MKTLALLHTSPTLSPLFNELTARITPGAVANAGLASAILPLPAIAEAIQASCGVPV